MPSYDCAKCLINYPGSRGGGKCPICDETLVWNFRGTEDENWEEQVLHAKGIWRSKELPPLNVGTLSTTHGKTWISGAVLDANGYTDAQELDIIRVEGYAGDLFFELVGRTMGNVPGTVFRGWLVEQIDWKGSAENLTPAMFAGNSVDDYTGGD